MDERQEREHLDLANHHIAQAESRIAKQKQRIEELKAKGIDASEAEDFLYLMEDFLRMTKLHQSLILSRLGSQDLSKNPDKG